MNFTIGWPQLIWLALAFASIINTILRHGQPKTGKYDIWMTMISLVIVVALLYWGGFFDASGGQ